jgi:hypothetical protein
MNTSYTWVLARKILLLFLTLTILSTIAALFVRDSITQKLAGLAKITGHVKLNESKAEQVLMMLHMAENDFQTSLLSVNNKKSVDYKTKLSLAFKQIDTLLKENADTSQLTSDQRKNIKDWYKKKLKLSDDLFVLKHNFDSLLTVYSGFNTALNKNLNTQAAINSKEATSSTLHKDALPHKGLFGRVKDAILNKGEKSVTEINHTKTITGIDPSAQRILAQDKKTYVKKLQQLQTENVRLLNMQRDLIALNTHINNELERIISSLKEINYHIADEFKEMAFKNYQETTALLNRFYLITLFLVLVFAILLIIFIIQLNNAELLLRKENDTAVSHARQTIDELIKKIELGKDSRSPGKMEELKEIVQLAVDNNPAFLVKFNQFDPEFSKKLLDIAPNLIATEIEFCVLLRLNFETKEIARYTNTSVRAVEGKKYRIRRKLGIPSDQDINIWMTAV